MKNRFMVLISFCIISACVLSTFVVFLILRDSSPTQKRAVSAEERVTRILIAGMDDCAENTDVLMLLNVSHIDGKLDLLQIPRDTFVRYNGKEGKINRFYHAVSKENGRNSGADAISKIISELFCMPIDAYIVLSTDALETLVDSMGGIEIDVPYAFDYLGKDGTSAMVKEGYQHVSGESAVAYLRHRSSYAEGDLGRLDAQMRFVAGVLNKIPSLRFPQQYLEIYRKNLPNLLTNLGEKDIINLMIAYLKGKGDTSFHITRLPGEACLDKSGVWYYVLNKNAASELLSSRFSADLSGGFDAEKRFTREGDETFMNIYGAKSFSCRIYSLEEAQKAKVLHK